jgi:hypothetical protein
MNKMAIKGESRSTMIFALTTLKTSRLEELMIYISVGDIAR